VLVLTLLVLDLARFIVLSPLLISLLNWTPTTTLAVVVAVAIVVTMGLPVALQN
jgi:hypothetical protein